MSDFRDNWCAFSLWAFVLSFFLTPAATSAQSLDCEDLLCGKASQSPEMVGEITGNITDDATGLPLRGYGVSVYDLEYEFVASSQSNIDGDYSVRFLLPGEYIVQSYSSTWPHVDEVFEDQLCWRSCDLTLGTPVVLSTEDPIAIVDFGLSVGGTISGTVTEESSGLPIAKATVEAYDAWGYRFYDGATDENGAYVVGGHLTTGDYFVRISSDEYVDEVSGEYFCMNGFCDPVDGTPISVVVGEETVVDFSLTRGAEISGSMTAGGASIAIPGNVFAYSLQGALVGSFSVGSSGTFRISGLSAGDYFLKGTSRRYVDELYGNVICQPNCNVFDGERVFVGTGESAAGVDFVLNPGGSIAGKLSDASNGTLVSGTVYAFDGLGRLAGETVSVEGNYRIEGLPENDYLVYVEAEEFVDTLYPDIFCINLTCSLNDVIKVSVLAGQTSGNVNLELVRGGVLSVGETVSADSGIFIPKPLVRVYDSEGIVVDEGMGSSSGQYDANGLPSGNYFVGISDDNYVAEIFDDLFCLGLACDPLLGNPVPVVVGEQSTPMTVDLESGEKISGVIQGEDSQSPLADVSVRFLDENGNLLGIVKTDESGRFEIGGLLPGDYYLHIVSAEHVDVLYPSSPFFCYSQQCPIDGGEPVTVIEGEAVDLPIVDLRAGGAISGRIVEAQSGAILPRAYARAFDSNGLAIGQDASFIDANGAYYVTGLPPGPYFVAAFAWNWLPLDSQVFGGSSCPRSTCNVAEGVPVEVTKGSVSDGVDFALSPTEVIYYEDFEAPM